MSTNQQKKVVLINPVIIEILSFLVMVCYFLLRFESNLSLGRTFLIFDTLLNISLPVIFIVYLVLRCKQDKAKNKKPNPALMQRQFFMSSIFIFLWSFMFLMQSIGQNDFRFMEVLLSGITLVVIFIIIVINMHNQNELWEQERIDSESLAEE